MIPQQRDRDEHTQELKQLRLIISVINGFFQEMSCDLFPPAEQSSRFFSNEFSFFASENANKLSINRVSFYM